MFPTLSQSVVAAAGGGAANAALLDRDFSRVITVATVGDSVKLPPATSPTMCVVSNSAPLAMQVFCSGSDTVNGLSNIPQLGNSCDVYYSVAPGVWQVESGLGFQGGFPTQSSTSAIVATPGGNQGNSVVITTAINRIGTVVTAGDSVTLPAAKAGMSLTVANDTANSAGVFPAVGDHINALANNAVYALAAGKTAELYCAINGTWHAVLSA